mgnify:CR=1 FL=1
MNFASLAAGLALSGNLSSESVGGVSQLPLRSMPPLVVMLREGTPQEIKYLGIVAVSDARAVQERGNASNAEQRAREVVAGANRILEDSGLAPPLRLALVQHVANDEDPYTTSSPGGETNSEALLTSFNEWASAAPLPAHDVHVLFTGLQLANSWRRTRAWCSAAKARLFTEARCSRAACACARASPSNIMASPGPGSPAACLLRRLDKRLPFRRELRLSWILRLQKAVGRRRRRMSDCVQVTRRRWPCGVVYPFALQLATQKAHGCVVRTSRAQHLDWKPTALMLATMSVRARQRTTPAAFR